ncbi:class I SAM-dependent methyltransferase [Halalkalibacillus halophilus]|uniref:class I SAM-dependent methyltransferase n=1 Tax=Halalkalibacillus halophilus TaxID=392827 RepID=UPI003CCBA421
MWNEKAAFWHSKSEGMWEEGSRKSIIPFFSEHIPIHAKVLDIGCGDGYGSYRLWQKGYKVVGIDLSDHMIETAQKQVNEEMNDLSFKQADMLDLPYAEGSFDAVLAINSLEWTENPSEALAHILSKLNSGGYLCVGILGPTAKPRQNSYQRLYGEDVICNTMMPWEFEQLASEFGLELVADEGVYKKGVDLKSVGSLPKDLKQSLTFMWISIFRKK